MNYHPKFEIAKLEIELDRQLRKFRPEEIRYDLYIAIIRLGDADVGLLPRAIQKAYPLIKRIMTANITLDELERLDDKAGRLIEIHVEAQKYKI